MGTKRVTVTVDEELLAEVQKIIAEGHADSLSAWVNQAMRERSEHQRRRAAGEAAVRAFEAEFGEITEQEMAAQARADREESARIRATYARSRDAAS